LGWISGPAQYGGRGLSPVHELLYDTVEADYDVPDTGTLSVVGLGMIGPTILAHGQRTLWHKRHQRRHGYVHDQPNGARSKARHLWARSFIYERNERSWEHDQNGDHSLRHRVSPATLQAR